MLRPSPDDPRSRWVFTQQAEARASRREFVQGVRSATSPSLLTTVLLARVVAGSIRRRA